MLARPDTPGIYIHPVDADRGRIGALRTDIAGFVGIAERGPIGVPVAIRSMRQFESVFGRFIGGGYLAYAVRGFFENGGVLCRVVRIAALEAASASARIRLADGRFGLTLVAYSPGTWGNALTVRITPSRRAETLGLAGGDARATPVGTTQGFSRHALARISQGGVEIWRIVAAIDPVAGTLYWTHPDPELREAWEEPLAGIALDQSFRIERLDYDVAVSERGQLVSVDTALSPVAGDARFASDILRLPPALAAPVNDERLDERHPIAPSPVIATIADGTSSGWPAVPLLDPSGGTLALRDGIDGLTLLSAEDFIAKGLAAMEPERDVAILACPDIHIQPVRVIRDPLPPPVVDPCEPCARPSAVVAPVSIPDPELPPVFSLAAIHSVQAAMIEQCERLRDRVAIIDPPFSAAGSSALGVGPVRAWRSRFDSAFGALYHPWLSVPDPLARGGVRLVPPSGHVAGQHAAMDRRAGVHRAAADVVVDWAQGASLKIDAATHGLLNTDGINVIVAREGRPLRTLGARTMTSDPSWLFLPVRRLVCMLRDALEAATQWAAFEPNDDATRLLMQDTIATFLDRLWRQGALAGAVAGEAYQVRCDEVNNDATRRANGELHVDIGIAPSKPMEFIVLRIGRQANSFELIEDAVPRAAYVGGAH